MTLLVNIDVDGLTRAERFYCEGLDSRVGRRFEGWTELAALMADPFGNGFCLLPFTGRGYDEIAG